MKAYAVPLAFVLSLGVILPVIDAQDEKDNPEKKVEPKKTDAKKKIVRVDEATVLGSQIVRAKIRDILADENAKEIIVNTMNPQKYQEYVEFELKLRDQLPRIINLDENQKKEYYKKETANRLDLVFDGEGKSVMVTPEMRVRTVDPPKQFDATGSPRKVSANELAKLRGITRLPGYTGDFSSLRTGQVVELYVPRAAAAPKPPPTTKKKDFIGTDAALTGKPAPKMSAHMILVIQD